MAPGIFRKPLISLLAMQAAAVAAAQDHPRATDLVFAGSLDEAKAAAARDGSFVLIEFFDSANDEHQPESEVELGCGDPDLVELVGDTCVLLRSDVATAPETADQFNILRTPALVLLKDGREFDRHVDFWISEDLIELIESAKHGVTRVEAARQALAAVEGVDGNEEYIKRFRLMSALRDSDRPLEAVQVGIDLWLALPELNREIGAAEYGQLLIGPLVSSALEREQPLALVRAFRTDLADSLGKGEGGYRALKAWAELNKRLGESELTVAWAHRVQNTPNADRALAFLGNYLVEPLIESGDWALAGRCVGQPRVYFRTAVGALNLGTVLMSWANDGEIAGDANPLFRSMHNSLLDEIADAYAACLAADRLNAAAEVAVVMKVVGDDWHADRVRLVRHAKRANELRDFHLAWLTAAMNAGVEVDRELLAEAKAMGSDIAR